MFIKQSALHFLYLSRYANAYKYKHPIFAFIFLCFETKVNNSNQYTNSNESEN